MAQPLTPTFGNLTVTGTTTLASGSLTGTFVALTATAGTNSTQLATTAFVTAAVSTGAYTLPVATSSILGGVKPDGVTITNSAGVLSITYGTGANTSAQGNDSRIVGAEQSVNKGAASGYAPLDATARVPFANLPTGLGEALFFAGTWNAATNTPTLASGTGTNGSTYVVTAAGTTTLDGISSWNVGDKAVFDGLATAAWQKIDGQALEVVSVAGRTGIVTLSVADVTGAAPLANPTFTGTVAIPSGALISGYLTTAQATSTYAPLASPVFSGTVTIPAGALISGYALLASPTFSGLPLAPTATAGTNTTQLATTAFVTAAVSTGAYSLPVATSTILGGVKPDGTTLTNSAGALSVTYGTGANTAAQGNDSRITGALSTTSASAIYAPIASPTFTGSVSIPGGTINASIGATTPYGGVFSTLQVNTSATAPTPSIGSNSTNVATTAYVYQSLSLSAAISTTGGSTTLAATQYGLPILLVTGTLSAAATLIVPANGAWAVCNRTSGAFTLTVKTASGSGIVIDQGYSAEVLADGTNVVLATSDFNGITLQGTIPGTPTFSGLVTLSTLMLTGLPTSSSGLPTGTCWSDGGVLCIA